MICDFYQCIVVVFWYVYFEDLGIFEFFLIVCGYWVDYVDVDVQVVDIEYVVDVDLFVVFGGLIGVDDIESYFFLWMEKEVIVWCFGV